MNYDRTSFSLWRGSIPSGYRYAHLTTLRRGGETVHRSAIPDNRIRDFTDDESGKVLRSV